MKRQRGLGYDDVIFAVNDLPGIGSALLVLLDETEALGEVLRAVLLVRLAAGHGRAVAGVCVDASRLNWPYVHNANGPNSTVTSPSTSDGTAVARGGVPGLGPGRLAAPEDAPKCRKNRRPEAAGERRGADSTTLPSAGPDAWTGGVRNSYDVPANPARTRMCSHRH